MSVKDGSASDLQLLQGNAAQPHQRTAGSLQQRSMMKRLTRNRCVDEFTCRELQPILSLMDRLRDALFVA